MHVSSINVRVIRRKNTEVLVLVLRSPKGSKQKRKLNDVINQTSSRTTDELYHLLSIIIHPMAILNSEQSTFCWFPFCMTISKFHFILFDFITYIVK